MSVAEEKTTIEKMILLYCRAKHGKEEGLCPRCRELYVYALDKLDKCPFGDAKKACAKCRVHCYKPAMRKEIVAVMRFSGPRMFLKDPRSALRHVFKGLKTP